MFVSAPSYLGLCCKDLEARSDSGPASGNIFRFMQTYLLLGREAWETRTLNSMTIHGLSLWLGLSTQALSYVFREQGRSCTFSELVLEVTAFCWLQGSLMIQRERAQTFTSLPEEFQSVCGHVLRLSSGLYYNLQGEEEPD